jgi:hypothetical protein
MASITFNKFDLGIDLRKGGSVSDANRLRDMKNAYVTTGLATRKRPGTSKITTLEPGTKGLYAALGKLNTFYGSSATLTHADTRFKANKARRNSTTIFSTVTEVNFVDVFNGYLYASLQFDGTIDEHHYFDGSTPSTYIADANCPNTKAVIKLASKIFAVSAAGDTVRYSKTGNPRDWTTANDAGFLPTGLNAKGDRSTNALGMYQSKLVALARDGAQVWTVDPNPTAMHLDDIVDNVGTSFPRSLASVAGDLYFLGDFGFRSITTLQLVSKLADVDIGSPIDTIVRPALLGITTPPRAAYYYGTGQYICAVGNQLFVYSLSRTAKIAAWSRYIMPFTVDAITELQGVLYFRSADDVYQFTDQVNADSGAAYEVLLEMPYMDFKSPGQTKIIYGIDTVMEGTCEFSIGFDGQDPLAVTAPVRVQGNTRGKGVVPIVASGTEFSPRFRNYDNLPYRLDALTIYYDVLGPM